MDFLDQRLIWKLYFCKRWFVFHIVRLHSFNEELIGRIRQQKLHMYGASLNWNIFFRNYQLYFFIQVSVDKFWLVNSFQTWNNVSHCSQWKLDGLEVQKIAQEYSSSWTSNSFIAKFTKWSSSIIVKLQIFITCNLIFLHDSRLQSFLQPSMVQSTVSYWQKVILF